MTNDQDKIASLEARISHEMSINSILQLRIGVARRKAQRLEREISELRAQIAASGPEVSPVEQGSRPRLTRRQMAVLDYIRSFRAQHRISPSQREIGVALGIKSTNGVSDHLRALEKKGYIRVWGGRSRAIIIVEEEGAPLR